MSEQRREICVVRVKDGDGWRAVFVIDGRRYADPGAVRSLKIEAFDELQRNRVPAEFETREVSQTEPPMRLPSWEEYRRRFDQGPDS